MNASMARSSSLRLCAADNCVRIRSCPRGTTGKLKGATYTRFSSSRAAISCARRLAQRAGDPIHPTHEVAMLNTATPGLAHTTHCVAFIEHHHGTVLFSQSSRKRVRLRWTPMVLGVAVSRRKRAGRPYLFSWTANSAPANPEPLKLNDATHASLRSSALI